VLKTVVYIPVRSNDGRTFPRRLWRELELRLRPFGGFTRGPRQRGSWHDGTRWYHEPNHPYYIALRSAKDLPAWLAFVA
jgi:hypothetical protein